MRLTLTNIIKYRHFLNTYRDDATSKTIETKNKELNDNENQTSTYIGSWKKKSDNINQSNS